MTAIYAFALGFLAGGGAVAATGWHLARSWRAAWQEEQRRAITSTAACERLADRTTGFVL